MEAKNEHPLKTIIIRSIGTANPAVAKALADAFEINHELLVKMLYNTPSVFLENANEEIAVKAVDLLTQLGLEVYSQDSGEPLPSKSEPLDVAVHITDPLKLPIVTKQIAEFIGCKESEAMQLLLNEPSVVLGGVSLATANILQKRLDAEVIASNPKTDLFALEITSTDPLFLNQFFKYLKDKGIRNSTEETKIITDLSYTKAQELWTRYFNSDNLKVFNQSYQRYQIQLTGFDTQNEAQTNFLIHQIGMPSGVLETIHENLPVTLDESLNVNDMQSKIVDYSNAGLECEAAAIPFGKYKLAINNITDIKEVKKVVSQFYEVTVLSDNTKHWTAPLPLNSVLNRYLEKQLELIGCEVEHQYSEV